MRKALKDELLARAEALHAEGCREDVIAASLGISERSVGRWLGGAARAKPSAKPSDGEAGNPLAEAATEPERRSCDLRSGDRPDSKAPATQTPAAQEPPASAGGPASPLPEGSRAKPARPGRRTATRRGLCRLIERRLADLVHDCTEPARQAEDGQGGGAPDAKDAKAEERILRLCKILEALRSGEDNLRAQLDAMKGFAAFCTRTLTEEEMTPVRKAVRLFLDALKKEHS